MNRFKLVIAMVLLVASIVLLFSYLLNPQPIQIILETGQEVTSHNPNYFTITSVIILIVCAFVIGAASIYLFYNADNYNIFTKSSGSDSSNPNNSAPGQTGSDYKMILPLLKSDEKKVVHALIENKGEMLQNALVLKLGLSKVKMTRLLTALHDKQIIIKERHGLTNKIKLKKM